MGGQYSVIFIGTIKDSNLYIYVLDDWINFKGIIGYFSQSNYKKSNINHL